jgi:hypothetical protein
MTIRRIGLPLLIALSIAGCANGAADPAGAPAAAPAASSVAPSSDVPTEEATTKPGGENGTKTLTGTITAGVEPGCLLLDDHLLLIQDEKLKTAAQAGASVTVTGRADQGLMTTCQQGTPFVVTAIRPN